MVRNDEHYEFGDDQIDKEYREYVDRQFSEACGQEFSNHSILHAWYIFKKILEYARNHKQEVMLISGRLRMDFYDALLKHFRDTLEEGVRVRALVVNTVDGGKENQLAQALIRHKQGGLYEIDEAEVALSQHLIVCANGGAYRLEMDHDRARATVAFGNTDFGLKIARVVDGLFPPD